MRGIRRHRPASQEGEQLRDVMLWLWGLEYCDSAGSQVAFMSNDSGFWDTEQVHPQIDADLKIKEGRIGIYRSIIDFLQRHAPAPKNATQGWIEQHFKIQAIDGQLIERAWRDLSGQLGGVMRDFAIEGYEVLKGKIYDVAKDTQFAELALKVIFRFTHIASPISQESETLNLFTGGTFGSRFGSRYGGRFGGLVPVVNLRSAPELMTRGLRCDAFADVSVRVKKGEPSEISLDNLTIDRAQLWKLAMADKTLRGQDAGEA